MKFKVRHIAFSAPSGAGKTTIVKELIKKHKELVVSVSATTRAIRPGEINAIDYHFLTADDFKAKIEQGRFLEYEDVHGQYYGTLTDTVESLVEQGKVILYDIDVNGALAVKSYFPDAILIFIKPPSEAELVNRLKGRNSETESTIRKRLERLNFEYEQAKQFDFIVVNDHLNDTILKIEKIILENA